MSKGKIAPDVVPVLENTVDLCHGERVIAARRQAKALLAVARAAEWEVAPLMNTEGWDIGGGHADSCRCKLCRALSRLRRASGTGSKP